MTIFNETQTLTLAENGGYYGPCKSNDKDQGHYVYRNAEEYADEIAKTLKDILDSQANKGNGVIVHLKIETT